MNGQVVAIDTTIADDGVANGGNVVVLVDWKSDTEIVGAFVATCVALAEIVVAIAAVLVDPPRAAGHVLFVVDPS